MCPSDHHIDLRKLVLAFLSVAQNLPAARLLPARTGRGTLRSDLLRLELSLDSNDFNLDRIKPLLRLALAGKPDDSLIWKLVYDAVTESTPPPRLTASSLQQTPWLRNTSSFANSSEHRKYVDGAARSSASSRRRCSSTRCCSSKARLSAASRTRYSSTVAVEFVGRMARRQELVY